MSSPPEMTINGKLHEFLKNRSPLSRTALPVIGYMFSDNIGYRASDDDLSTGFGAHALYSSFSLSTYIEFQLFSATNFQQMLCSGFLTLFLSGFAVVVL